MHCGNAKVNVSREQIVIEGVMSALGTKRTCDSYRSMSAYWGWSQPVDATLYLRGKDGV